MSDERQQGSILIEVLVAFTILAMAIIMSFDVLGAGVRRVVEARQRTSDIRLAQAEIDRLRLQPVGPAGLRQGREGDLIWLLDVIDLEPLAGVTPQRVVFRARRGALPGPDDVLLETVVLPRQANR